MTSRIKDFGELRVAWLMPSAKAGAHWLPIWTTFLEHFKDTVFFTTQVWEEFDSESSYAKAVCQLGDIKSIWVNKKGLGYHHGFLKLPFNIILYLARFRPKIIISNAFSMWSLIAILLKPLFAWKVIILYEGSTPNSDFKNSKLRLGARRFISKNSDAFIANTKSAKKYLIDFIGIDKDQIVNGPYLLPDKSLMLSKVQQEKVDFSKMKRPIFLSVGQVIDRKGIFELIEACSHLNSKGFLDYTLIIVGDGSESVRLDNQIEKRKLAEQVVCVGRVDYGQLGYYFQESDVFVFPTYEDTWGMSCLEAMAYGKPVLCSQHAGCSELVEDGINGYIIDPYQPIHMANKMYSLVDTCLVKKMGECSAEIIGSYVSAGSVSIFNKAIEIALK